jgi:hypothetical protein
MARLIDADALMDDVEMDNALFACLGSVGDVRYLVDSQRIVDAEKVVRCKKCYYYDEKNPGRGHCKYFDILRADNDFCSSGEER